MSINPRAALALALVVTVMVGGGLGLLVAGKASADPDADVTVYLTPTCGCCGAWVDYLREEGFSVDAEEVNQTELNGIKQEAGLTPQLASCHTAFVGDYAVEGHVPAREIRRLLAEEPDIAGIAVPGMPAGSPGMEMGDRKDPYDVVAFRANGDTEVFARYHQD